MTVFPDFEYRNRKLFCITCTHHLLQQVNNLATSRLSSLSSSQHSLMLNGGPVFLLVGRSRLENRSPRLSYADQSTQAGQSK
jgi:hypothetical protein